LFIRALQAIYSNGLAQHKNKTFDGFSKRYNTTKLVYFEQVQNSESAIVREKQIKNWRREKKDNLIEQQNPEWHDLYDNLF